MTYLILTILLSAIIIVIFKAMGLYQASFLFPVVHVSVVVPSSLAGVVAFKEVLKRINIIGVIMATMAIVLITIE